MNITSESNSNFTFNRSDILTENIQKNLELSVQNGGGLFCKDEFTKILLECFSDDRPDIACYLLCKLDKVPNDITMCIENKRNILHYMTIYASHNNIVIHLSKLLRDVDKDDIETALNSQDNNGNTPLHYATLLGYNNLVKLYIENGADSTIKNKNGQYVEKDDTSEQDINIIVTEKDGNHTFSFRRNMIEEETVDDRHIQDDNTFTFNRNILDEITTIDNLLNENDEDNEDNKDNEDNEDTVTEKNLHTNNYTESSVRTEHFLNEIENVLNKNNLNIKKHNHIADYSVNVTDIFDDIVKNHKNKEMIGGMQKNNLNSDSTLNTTDILNNIVTNHKNNSMIGGNNQDNKLNFERETVNTKSSDINFDNINQLSINTNDIIKNIISKTNDTMKGGNDNLNDLSDLSINTNDIISNIISKTNLTKNTEHDILIGGGIKSSKHHKKSKKSKRDKKIARIHGERIITTFSEISVSSSSKSKPLSSNNINLSRAVESDGSDISDIARQISRQSSDIHERSVMKIIEILKLDKNNPDDMQKARNYKAAIYKMVREKNPLLNNFDRAVEMEKLITKETLAKIDINKVTKEIEKYMSEKSASKTTTDTTKDTTTSASKTATSASKTATSASKTATSASKTATDSEKKIEKKSKTSKKEKSRQYVNVPDSSFSLTFNTSSVSSSEFSTESN
jgi:hypothetical protein